MKKIAIVTPIGSDSGGPEALYQLCSALIKQGLQAYIYPLEGSEDKKPVDRFSYYRCPIDTVLSKETILVVPEIVPHLILRADRTILWWLSIDNSPLIKHPEIAFETNEFYQGDALSTNEFWTKFHSASVTHLAQSFYAKNYLKAKYSINSQMLTDYIPQEDFAWNKKAKSDLVTFSLKGLRFFDFYAENLSDYECLRIAGMSRNEVLLNLAHSRLYIDLGGQPGRDRLPREASILHTYVMLNKKGAGNFFKDAPLSNEYKFNVTDPYETLSKIKNVLRRKPSPSASQIIYREWVKKQKAVFDFEVRKLVKQL